jgi:two-component system, NarL family, response regulator LiaR
MESLFSHSTPIRVAFHKQSSPLSDDPGSHTVRLLLADDHLRYRQGLRQFIENWPDFQVVGEAQNGQEAVQLALALRPHVILMDQQMPVLDGIQATLQIIEQAPDIGVILLSIYREPQRILDGLQAGAKAHLLKDTDEEGLLLAILAVARGEALIDSQIARLLVEHLRQAGPRCSWPSIYGQLNAVGAAIDSI